MGTTAAADIVWYSRLLVLVGSAGLLLEAFLQAGTGHSVGGVTLLCTLAIIVGLPVFIVAMWLESRPQSAVEPASPLPARAPQKPPKADRPVLPAASPPPASAPQPQVQTQAAASSQAGRAEAVPSGPRRVSTRELAAGDALAGAMCPVCQQRLGVGQLAAACPQCGAGHHASCWIDNRFRCGRPGCSGAGGLEAPGDGTSSSA